VLVVVCVWIVVCGIGCVIVVLELSDPILPGLPNVVCLDDELSPRPSSVCLVVVVLSVPGGGARADGSEVVVVD